MAELALERPAVTDRALRPVILKPDAFPQVGVPAPFEAPANDVRPHLPERLAPDLPPAVGFLLVGAFAWTIGAYLITFWSDLRALEMVAVDIVYLATYLGVPWLEPKASPNPTFAEFLARGLETFTGHLTGAEALCQILTIPVSLAAATTAMCLVAVLA
jgi:hypothetical protein